MKGVIMKFPVLCITYFLTLEAFAVYDNFQDAMKAGDNANSKKNFAVAATAYENAFAKAADTPQKYLAGSRYARALSQSGKITIAVETAKKIMELPGLNQTEKLQATYMYAWYLLAMKKNTEAEKILETAVKETSMIQFDLYDLYLNALCAQKKFTEADQAMTDMEKTARTQSQKKRVIQKKIWLEGRKK